MKPFYITTPIYYVNDKPHIGHAYTTILADVVARHHRNSGKDVFFLTGLDEHGQKVQQAAEKRGVDPKKHCDEMAPRFLELWKRLHIQYDDFIRTTEKRHTDTVKKILQNVYDKGDIYEDSYEGLYSVSEERFITKKEFDSGQFGEAKQIKEKNYFFRMSKYQKTLIDKIEKDELLIQPKSRKNEVLGFLKNELSDLCISRPKSRLEWGIELPFDDNYVTYVWFDALINYISAIGAYSNDEQFSSLWPADVHLIGKDILTTHSVYWPTMLLSLGLPLPQRIFAHGWWLTDDQKMSKSLGNVVSPLMLIDDFGVDSVRYYLMSEMVLGMDATFSSESFEKKYNSDLANDFGNLVSRISTLIKNNFDEKIPESSLAESDLSTNFQKIVLKEQLDNLQIDRVINDIMTFIRSINVFMEQNEPWKLVKSDKVQAGNILYHCAESLRLAAVMLSPVMPSKTNDILDILGTNDVELVWGKLESGSKISISKPIFPRIS